MRKASKLHDVEKVKTIVSQSTSLRDVISKLGYKESGGMYVVLRRFFALHNIDTSHFQLTWNKGKTRLTDFRIAEQANLVEMPWDQAFSYGSRVSNAALLKRLVLSGKKDYNCEECKLREWNGRPIRLQLDHKNGDRLDCREDNLSIICPNCHSQTETFSRGKRTHKKTCHWWHLLSKKLV